MRICGRTPFHGITDSFLLPFFGTHYYSFRAQAHALAAFVPLTSTKKAFVPAAAEASWLTSNSEI
jgi:hypothetical protein